MCDVPNIIIIIILKSKLLEVNAIRVDSEFSVCRPYNVQKKMQRA
jgi:hypothetical protein